MAHREPMPVDSTPPEGAGIAFDFDPEVRASPLICSFPHVGLEWPEQLGRAPQVNLKKNADLAVDALAAGVSTARVRARFSRLVVDLNRHERDISRRVCPGHPDPRPRADPGDPDSFRAVIGPHHRGVVWHAAIGGVATLALPLAYPAMEDRLTRYHRPYLAALEALLDRRVQRFGVAMLLDIHSMPSSVRPDIVLSTCRGRSIRSETLEIARGALGALSQLDVRVDDPYAGGAITNRFGRPEQGVEALQVEFNRRLYLDESRLQLLDDRSRSLNTRRRPTGPRPADLRRCVLAMVSSLERHLLNQ